MPALSPIADTCGATRHVRLTPNSDRESKHAQMVVPASLPKAVMCGPAAYALGQKRTSKIPKLAAIIIPPLPANQSS
jgi:uncharacterized membrane-anchored protein